MSRAETRPLAISLGERVGKPHHTVAIGAVAKAVRVTQFMNRLGGDPATEASIGRSRRVVVLAQAGDRKQRNPSSPVSFAEHEIKVRSIEIFCDDAEQPRPFASFVTGEGLDDGTGQILLTLRIERIERKRQRRSEHDIGREHPGEIRCYTHHIVCVQVTDRDHRNQTRHECTQSGGEQSALVRRV
jgi:hypothetical protein